MAYANDIVSQMLGKENTWTGIQHFVDVADFEELTSNRVTNPFMIAQTVDSYMDVRNLADNAFMGLRASVIHAFTHFTIENLGAGGNPVIDSNSGANVVRSNGIIEANDHFRFFDETAFLTYIRANATGNRTITCPDKNLTLIAEEDALIGSANKEFIACSIGRSDQATPPFYFDGTEKNYKNVGAQDFSLYCELPLPTNRGGLKLYVKNAQVPLNDADAGDYLTAVQIMAIEADSDMAIKNTDATDKSTKAVHESTFTAFDASAYVSVGILLTFVCTNAGDLGFQAPLLEVYYE